MMRFIFALVIAPAVPALAALISDEQRVEVSDAAHLQSRDGTTPAVDDEILLETAPVETPDIACSGWSPNAGNLKGQGAYCAKWGADFNWCFVEENYKGFANEFKDKSTIVESKFFVPCPDSVANDHRSMVTLLDADTKEENTDEAAVLAKDAEIEKDRIAQAEAEDKASALEKAAKEAREKADKVSVLKQLHESEDAALRTARDEAKQKRVTHRKEVAAHKAKATADEMRFEAATAQADAEDALSTARDLQEITQALADPQSAQVNGKDGTRAESVDPAKASNGNEIGGAKPAAAAAPAAVQEDPVETNSFLELEKMGDSSVMGQDSIGRRSPSSTSPDGPKEMTLSEAQALVKKLKLINDIKPDESMV